MIPLTLTSIMLDDDAAIAAQAVAGLVTAQMEMNRAEAAQQAQRSNPFERIRSAIADFQERVTEGAWPSYVNRAVVREIAKAADAPADIVRHILRYPDCILGRRA